MKKTIAALLTTLTFNVMASSAMIFPQRAFLDSQNRTANFKVVNSKNIKSKYDIELDQRIQTETGATRTLEKGEHVPSAQDYLVYSPRKSITLDQNEKKPIRLKMKKYGELEDGEYRSYLKIVTSSANPEATQGYKVEVRTGIQLPIVIRKGKLSAKAGVENVKIDGDKVTFKLTRTGTRSIFGNISITQNGNTIGSSNGVAVYPERDYIKMSVPVSKYSVVLPVTVTFNEDEMSGNETASNTSAF